MKLLKSATAALAVIAGSLFLGSAAAATASAVPAETRTVAVSTADSAVMSGWWFKGEFEYEFSCDSAGAWEVMWTAATEWSCIPAGGSGKWHLFVRIPY